MSRHRTLAATAVVLLVASGTAALPLSPVGAAAAPCPAFFDENGDGFDDLVVGTPGEDLPVGTSQVDAGAVTIVRGDAAGLFGTNGSTLITQESLGLVSHTGDRFGAAVATADLNGDGCADLAIGIPGESSGTGAVAVVWGAASGLDLAHPQVLRQGAAPVGGSAEAGDAFGSALAVAGSLPTGGAAALWVGSPGEDVGTLRDAGLVTEVRASAGGLLGAAGVTNVSQNSAGVPGTAEAGDRFGERLSRGAGCSGATDESWVVGAPGEDIGSLTNTGIVTLRDRVTGRGSTLSQGVAGVPGTAEAGDGFGGTLVDAGALVVGTPNEDVGTVVDAGAVTVVQLGCTSAGSIVTSSAVAWSQSSSGVAGSVAPSARFAASMGASLVTVPGSPLQYRLVVGSPGQPDGVVQGAGAVTVFTTGPAGLTTAGSKAFGQGSSGIAEDPETGDGFGGALDASNASVL